jgi:hypothetical protein
LATFFQESLLKKVTFDLQGTRLPAKTQVIRLWASSVLFLRWAANW